MSAPGPPRLLIVDDDAALLHSLCDILHQEGYATTGFPSALAAKAALATSRFDLLLADLVMPEMDGIALLRHALLMDPTLVVVIMTGEGTIGSAVESMRAGAYDYVLKPLKVFTLLPVLQRGLALRSLRTENGRLEQRLRERAVELEAANRELEAFTRSASHDLRSPLGGIIGLCSLLQARFGRQMPGQAVDWLRKMEGEAHRMTQLLDVLMRLSRMGRQTLELRPVDVTWLVREVLQELRPREPERSLDVLVDAMPPAQADASLLRQVFVNLVSNAFKFTRGAEHALVSIGAQDLDGQVAYCVRDNGAGFDMAEAGKLFESFQRLPRHRGIEGSGVGLSIAHRIVERHGGRIWFDSAPGQGACFCFTLGTSPGSQAAGGSVAAHGAVGPNS